jgi:hypothetical protein
MLERDCLHTLKRYQALQADPLLTQEEPRGQLERNEADIAQALGRKEELPTVTDEDAA